MDADVRQPGKLCDVCGQEVAAEEAVTEELAIGDLTCPTAMVLHPACYEAASQMWQPDTDSYCTVDPEFPETQRWPVAGAPEA